MAEKKAIIATKEIDLTDYKFNANARYQSASYSLVFEKKFESNDDGEKMYERLDKIISATKIYATGYGDMPHLIPVANFKINDIFGINNGQPISCLGRVNAVYNTSPSKIAFVIEMYNLDGTDRKFKNVKVIKEDTLDSRTLRDAVK